MKNIGILALQGDSLEHFNALRQIKNVKTFFIKNKQDLNDNLHGLILPGGESTTIGKLIKRYNLAQPIKKMVRSGVGIYGTCAGCILISKYVDSPYSLELINIEVKRNAYGRQVESFIDDLDSPVFKNLSGVFIRAPKITKIIDPDIKILASYKKNPVLVQQDNILAGTFHPELTDQALVHEYFVKNCC